MDDPRFHRLEAKVDEMGQVLVTLARIEERLTTLFHRFAERDRQGERTTELLATLSLRIDGITNAQLSSSLFFRWADRIGIAVVTAGVATVFYMFRMRGP